MRCSSPEDGRNAAASALRSASAGAEGEGSAPGVAFGLRIGVVLRCGAGGRSLTLYASAPLDQVTSTICMNFACTYLVEYLDELVSALNLYQL
jgi:hypothetical protein